MHGLILSSFKYIIPVSLTILALYLLYNSIYGIGYKACESKWTLQYNEDIRIKNEKINELEALSKQKDDQLRLALTESSNTIDKILNKKVQVTIVDKKSGTVCEINDSSILSGNFSKMWNELNKESR